MPPSDVPINMHASPSASAAEVALGYADWGPLEVPEASSHAAELQAYSLINKPCIQPQTLDALLDLLPAGDFPRGQHFAGTRAFSAGLYIHGGVCGLRAGTRQFPWVCRLVCLFARRLAPDFCFTSFSLVRDCQAGLHKDSHNDANTQNCLFACSRFHGGELWTEASNGQHPLLHQGHLLHGDAVALPYGQPVFFSARQLMHCVLPWKGRRTVLICFSVRDSARLSCDDFQTAALHGFPLPQAPLLPQPDSNPLARAKVAAVPARSEACFGLGRPSGSSSGSAAPSPPSSGPWFWEVFAGSARLSLAASKAGFQVLAVDHQHNRHKPCLPLLMLDLSQPSAQDHLFRLWEQSAPSFVHIGIPCGTSSRARERPLPATMCQAGAPQPQPLRSQTHPFGLPTLQGRDLYKVQKANALARFCIRLIYKAWETGTPFVVENPARAHTWALLRAIVHEIPCQRFHLWYDRLQVITFSACMHGSLRDKRTSFLTSADCLSSLRLDCNRQHEHAAWSVRYNNGQWSFDTAAEAEYPFLVCTRYVACLMPKCGLPGSPPLPGHLQRLAAAQKQSRRGKPLIPEFASFRDVHSLDNLPPHKVLEPRGPNGRTLSARDATSKTTISQVSQGAEEVLSGVKAASARHAVLSKVSATSKTTISQVPQGAEEGRAADSLPVAGSACEGDATSKTTISQVPQGAEEARACASSSPVAGSARGGDVTSKTTISQVPQGAEEAQTRFSHREQRFRVGLYHTPMEFVEAALACQHPYDSFDIEDDVARLILANLTKSPLQLAKERLQAVTKVNQLKKELAVEEARLKATLPHHVQKVLGSKPLLLWARLLEDTGFPDMGVWDLMLGTDLTGVPTKSPLYGEKVKLAATSHENLIKAAPWRNHDLISRQAHSTDPSHQEILWNETLKERDKGFVQGPFASLEEVAQSIGCSVDDMCVTRRFLILQGTDPKTGAPKPRVIDDAKESMINSAYTALELLALHDLDYVSGLAGFIGRVISMGPSFRHVLSSGEVLQGVVHPAYGPRPRVKGRCLDLSKAYKQVPISSKSLPLGVILVHDPSSGKPAFFTTASMPFGCSASVFSFNRISRSLLHVLRHMTSVVGGVFYDDYALLETEACCGMASKAACSLLDQLGWLYAKDESKGRDFEESFDLLGARLDLSELHEGYLKVSNKPSRKLKLLEMLDGLLASPESSRQAAKSIHGILNFMNGSTLGQHLKLAARAFANLSSAPECPSKHDLELLVEHTKKALDEALPRRWNCHSSGRPIIVLTDGSYEKGRALWGAVLLDPENNLRAVHHGAVPWGSSK